MNVIGPPVTIERNIIQEISTITARNRIGDIFDDPEKYGVKVGPVSILPTDNRVGERVESFSASGWLEATRFRFPPEDTSGRQEAESLSVSYRLGEGRDYFVEGFIMIVDEKVAGVSYKDLIDGTTVNAIEQDTVDMTVDGLDILAEALIAGSQ